MLSLPLNTQSSITIDKDIYSVYKIVSDFNTWPIWSPWLCQEKDCERTVINDPQTIGHQQDWSGERIGSGSMKLSSFEANKELHYNLNFIKPWKSKSLVSFTFKEVGGGTQVIWTMKGTIPIFLFFMKKMMEAFITCDYERGLVMLKSFAETGKVQTDSSVKEVLEKSGFSFYGIKKECSIETMPENMKITFSELIKNQDIPTPDFSLSFYNDFNMVKKSCSYTAAFAYKEPLDISSLEHLVQGQVKNHKAVSVDHIGEYKYLGNAWSTAMSYLRSKKLKTSKKIKMYEVYHNMPGEVPDSEIRTEICLPLR